MLGCCAACMGEAPKHGCMAPSSYFCMLPSYLFPAMPRHMFPFRPTSAISANGLGRLLPIRVRNVSVPFAFVQFVLALILWASSLTPIFFRLLCNHLFSIMARPGCKRLMLKKCLPNNIVASWAISFFFARVMVGL